MIRADAEAALAGSFCAAAAARLRRVCDRLGLWIQLAALEGIEEPGVRARAEPTRLRHLSEGPIRDGYGDLVERCARRSEP